jgi:DNA-binding winged helix-turn-helix (wHTH) protein/tetratricopeptide (TPR) repeat protein
MEVQQFLFGEWLVDPSTNSIHQSGERKQMEPRAMEVLVVLCQAAGKIVSADELLAQCWRTDVYGDNPVHKILAQLRRLLGDTATAPSYIETVRKRGYRTLAPVSFGTPDQAEEGKWADRTPFRGLHAFDEEHANVFFGRDEATRRLVAAVDSQVEARMALQLVLGPSGSGKSSLVRAGLFPAMAPSLRGDKPALLSTTTFDLKEQGEQSLFGALASAMLDLHTGAADLFDGDSATSLARRLEQDREGVLSQMTAAAVTARAAGRAGAGPLCFGIFIDHFEALFAPGRCPEVEREALFSLIEDLAHSGVALLVIGCRNDFYPHIARHPLLMDGKPNGAHFDLTPPTFAEIAQIIRLPVAAAGLSFGVDPQTGARLDDVLCESAAASPDALPLLQYCLQELYALRSSSGELNFDAFRQLGGVEGAIAQRAEQVVARFGAAQKSALERVMSLVVVIAANEETVTSRRAPWSALKGEAERQVVDALVESRLFVSELLGDVPGFGIAHEAILRRWPRIREWIEVHKNALLEHARLANQTARWVREGRSAELLLPRGKQLEAARALQASGQFALTDDQAQLIRLSLHRARRGERLRLLAMGAIVLLALLALALGVSATGSRKLAEKRRIEAEGLMGYMLGDFADKLRPLGRLDLLDSVSTKALGYLGAARDEKLSMTALAQRAQALQVIAEVRRARGDSKGAAQALDAAQDILMEQHAKAPANVEVLKNLGVNAYWLGQIAKDQSDFGKAASHWKYYLKFSDDLNHLEPDNVTWWIEQSYAHNNLGSLAASRGDPATAAREFEQSIALKRRALDRQPGARTLLEELADSYSWLGAAKESLGELKAADELYAQEMAIVQKLREAAPSEPLWIRSEAWALRHHAANELAQGQDDAALRDYRAALALMASLTKSDEKNLGWQAEAASLEVDEHAIMARTDSGEKILARMQDIHARLGRLAAADPKNVVWGHLASLAQTRLAEFLLKRGQAQTARQEARGAVARLRQLYDGNKENKAVRRTLIRALLVSADIDNAAGGGGAAAQTVCLSAQNMLGLDTSASRDHHLLDPWVRVNFCLGKEDAARQAVGRLRSFGYRDRDYLQFLSLQNKTKGKS